MIFKEKKYKRTWLGYGTLLSVLFFVLVSSLGSPILAFAEGAEGGPAAEEQSTVSDSAADPPEQTDAADPAEPAEPATPGEPAEPSEPQDVSPSPSCAEVTEARAFAKKKIRIRVKVPQRVASVSEKYFLFTVVPKTNALKKKLRTVKRSGEPDEKLSFTLSMGADKKGVRHPEYILKKYALAVRTKKGSGASCFKRISPAFYIKSPQNAAVCKKAYQFPKTKKGLQDSDLGAIDSTASKCAFNNLYISSVLARKEVRYRYDGKTYYFAEMNGYHEYVRECNKRHIPVTLQIMLDNTPETRSLTYAGGKGPKKSLQAFKIDNAGANRKMEAIFSYLAETFGKNDCYVSNWILGNEVNSSTRYYYMGKVSQAKFIDNYARTFRTMYNAVRGYRASSKVFICLEHCWNMKNPMSCSFKGKSVVKAFAKKINKLQGGVSWNLAYHAYPADLTKPGFWKDPKNLVNGSTSTPIISMKNLHVLTDYIRKNYGKNVRISISEIGYHIGDGQKKQAAAHALGYAIAACNPQVDSYMVRSYRDDPNDAVYGVILGIKYRLSETVYRYIDSRGWQTFAKKYLKASVGKKWKKYVKNYKSSRLYGYYRK